VLCWPFVSFVVRSFFRSGFDVCGVGVVALCKSNELTHTHAHTVVRCCVGRSFRSLFRSVWSLVSFGLHTVLCLSFSLVLGSVRFRVRRSLHCCSLLAWLANLCVGACVFLWLHVGAHAHT
jgi:hypothetical protein